MAKFCTECGSGINSTAKFCEECGNTLGNSKPSNKESTEEGFVSQEFGGQRITRKVKVNKKRETNVAIGIWVAVGIMFLLLWFVFSL